MYDKRLIDYLINNNIDINLMIKRNEQELAKFEALRQNSMLIDTRTLKPVDLSFMKGKDSNSMYIVNNSDKLFLLKEFCLKLSSDNMVDCICNTCKESNMMLCIYNNLYKRGSIFVKKERE